MKQCWRRGERKAVTLKVQLECQLSWIWILDILGFEQTGVAVRRLDVYL